MKILIDSNVLIDYVAVRTPYYEDAHKIMKLCSDKKVYGAIAVSYTHLTLTTKAKV